MYQKFMKMMNKKNKGFTLVELMVVVVIIGILVAIAIPVYNATTTNAQNKANAANIRVIEGAVQAYLADNGGTYANAVVTNTGAISGTGITAGDLAGAYIKTYPTQPDGTGSYTKAANGNVVAE